MDLCEIKPIEVVEQSDVNKVDENKIRMLKLFGVANQLYLSSCKILKIQPDYNYIDVLIIDNKE